jgi:hypothetical protein
MHITQQKLARQTATRLVRTFLTTGELRSPLIGVWSLVTTPAAMADDPEPFWPAVWTLLLRRALHPHVILLA